MIDAVALLQKLVAIDSTSSRSNLPVLDVLEAALRPLGFEARRQEWKDAAGVAKANLIAWRGPRGEGAGEGEIRGGLALVGHSDCVPFDPAWAGALAGEQRDGKLYGRGSADTKAFLAAAVAAAARTQASRLPLTIVSTADEEVGCLGAKRLLDEGRVRPGHAIVGEPTQLIPVVGHKGYCLAEIVVEGAEGHSAFPEAGASAILAAGRLLRDLERVAAELALEQDPAFQPPFTTLNVGLIQGGKAKNVIPGRCTLTLEWRPVPGQDVRRALRLVEQACAALVGPRIRATVQASRLDVGVLQPKDSPLALFLSGESGRAAETIPFGTELPHLSALGASACVFGPGDIREAHRTGEFVPLDELAAAERILARAIERFCA